MSALKNNRWLSIATLILLAANIITLALLWAQKRNQENDRMNKPGQAEVFEFLVKELQLDEKQQATYKELRNQHQASQRQFQDSIRNAKDAMFSLLNQPNVSDSTLQEYSRKAMRFEQQMDIITFRHFQQVRALCNPVQQKKFDDVIKEALRRMAGPRGHRPPPGGPGSHPPPPDREIPEQP